MSNAIVLPYHNTARGAREFNGVNQYLIGPPPVTQAPITLSAWIKWDEAGTWDHVLNVARANTATDHFAIYLTSTGLCRAHYAPSSGGTSIVETSEAVTVGEWAMLTGVATLDYTSIYRNAEDKDISIGSKGALINVDTSTIGIHQRGTLTNPFDGLIAEASIWNAPLTDAEIKYLYNNGRPRPAWEVRPESLVFYQPVPGYHPQLPSGITVPKWAMTEVAGPTWAGGPPRESRTTAKRFLPISIEAGPPTLEIAGSSTAVAETSGDLSINPPQSVAGSSTSVANTAGDLSISHPVAGVSTAVANTDGAFQIIVSVAGQSTAVANTAGELSISTPGGIAGSSNAVADTAGSLTISAPQAIAGSSTAVADTSGALAITHVVAGNSTAVANTAGSFTINVPGGISGSSRAVADTAGELSINEPSFLAGASTAVADTAGAFAITHFIAGTSTAVANTIGFVPVGKFTPQPCRVVTPSDSNPTVTVPDSNPTHISTEC